MKKIFLMLSLMIGVLLCGCKDEEIGIRGCPRDHAFVPQGEIENSGVAAEYLFYTVDEDIRSVYCQISIKSGEDGKSIWRTSKDLREEDGRLVGDWYEIEFVDSRTLRVRIDDNPTEHWRLITIAPDFCIAPIHSHIRQSPKNLGEESENSNY